MVLELVDEASQVVLQENSSLTDPQEQNTNLVSI